MSHFVHFSYGGDDYELCLVYEGDKSKAKVVVRKYIADEIFEPYRLDANDWIQLAVTAYYQNQVDMPIQEYINKIGGPDAHHE